MGSESRTYDTLNIGKLILIIRSDINKSHKIWIDGFKKNVEMFTN